MTRRPKENVIRLNDNHAFKKLVRGSQCAGQCRHFAVC